jgi:hypothetical protein
MLRRSASMRLTTFSCDGLTAGAGAGRFPCFFAQNAHKRGAIMILQHGWIELSRLRPDDVLRKLIISAGSFIFGTSLK